MPDPDLPTGPDTASSHDPMTDEQQPLLLFRVATGWFAVDATAVGEIAEMTSPMPLPRMPGHVPGLVFLGGQAVPLLDLALFLELAESEAQDTAAQEDLPERVVVVSGGGMRVGILSQQVRGVFEVPVAGCVAPQALGARVRRFSKAQVDHEVGLIAVLDLPALLRAAKPSPEPRK